MRCAARNLWESASGDWQKILRDSINFLPYHQPNIFEDQSNFFWRWSAPHITQIKSSAKVAFTTPRNLCSRSHCRYGRQLVCSALGGETKQRLHIWWHFKPQNSHRQPTQPLRGQALCHQCSNSKSLPGVLPNKWTPAAGLSRFHQLETHGGPSRCQPLGLPLLLG